MSDRFIRAAAALTVVTLGAIAAVISYRHAYTLAVQHGETGTTAALVPVTADGLLLVAGLVMLDAARRGVPAPPLARLALALGIVATIAANLAHGVAHGVVGALVAAWPAVTLILTVELLMGMIRRAQAAPVDVPDGTLAAELDEPERWSGGPVGMEWWETLPAVESAPEVVETARESAPEVVATALPEGDDRLTDGSATVADLPQSPAPDPDLAPVIATARDRFAEVLATGGLPSVRALRRELRIGHPRAVRVRAALEAETARESAPALF